VAIDAECRCCRIVKQFTFASPSDQVVCVPCARHIGGDKAEKRDADHVAMWADLYGGAIEEQRVFVAQANVERLADGATIADLRARVAELAGSIADSFEGPGLGGARGLVETEVTRRAERRTELAKRHNDRIMAVLWRLERLHRDADAGGNSCSCGRPTAACAEWKAIEPQRRSVRDWEARNVALLKGGQRHGLPGDHPEAT
jgi:hypothetical protein